MNSARVRVLNNYLPQNGPIVYWMVREQRVQDNWALIYAQELAKKRQQPLIVVFCIRKDLQKFAGTGRLVDYMFAGLQEVEQKLQQLHIPFWLLLSEKSPEIEVLKCIQQCHAGTVVVEESPLIEQKRWQQSLVDSLKIAVFQVDAHNIVPVWIASDKQEYGAYTLRPKIHKKLDSFLDEFPALTTQPMELSAKGRPNDWKKIRSHMRVNEKIALPAKTRSGSSAANNQVDRFLEHIKRYNQDKNDPVEDVTSHLSAHLHFGQISAQRIVLDIHKKRIPAQQTTAFLEELIVRRELAENFCFYNTHYRETTRFPNWAQESLKKHLKDQREHCYSESEFEQAKTHDPLWNAAQKQMVVSGYMHGYMRMYWAKKILEWTQDPQAAMSIAIFLNDRYQLDGRDPNGYVGIAWAIGGVHDRPWFERPIFGKVRYMNFNGAKKKFEVNAYIQKWSQDTDR